MKLIHGDCMNAIQALPPKSRLLLTDIPYDRVSRASNDLRNLDKGKADVMTFDIDDFLEAVYPKFDVFVIFCGNEQYSGIYNFFANKAGTVRQLIYAKSNPSPMNGEYVYLSGTENAVWFKKKGTGKLNCKCKKNVLTHPTGSSKIHPTEKNHKLLEEIILDNTNAGDLVVDLCMGSGSTGLVSLLNGRDFIGVELDKDYYDGVVERLAPWKGEVE